MTTRKVYVVVLNYVQWEDTCACIESLLRASYDNYSVIVVDNDSRNDSIRNIINNLSGSSMSMPACQEYSAEALNEQTDPATLPRLTFIQNEANAGFAGGNNVALQFLAGLDAYVWLLNPDMIVAENTLSELVAFAEKQPEKCIVGAEVRPLDGKHDPSFFGGGRVNFLTGTTRPVTDPNDLGKLDYISGGCLFTRATNFERYGLLPEHYFLYWEETEWCFSAKEKGALLLVCIGAVCYHKVSSVIGRGFLSDYYYCRNSLIFVSKFRESNVPIAVCAMSLRVLRRLISGEAGKARGALRGAIDFLQGKSGKAEFRKLSD